MTDVTAPRNLVVIVLDTVRPDHLGAEASSWAAATPRLDEFSRAGVRFDRAYAEFPLTVPFRTSLVTGTTTFTNRPWSGLRATDPHLAELVGLQGWQTAAFTDTPFRSDVGMDRGFDTFVEYSGKLRGDLAGDSHRPRSLPEPHIEPGQDADRGRWRRYAEGWATDQPGVVGVEALVDGAINWLDTECDSSRPFLLWVDSFQCHEPWVPPVLPDSGSRFLPLPSGPDPSWMQAGELEAVRALYRGEIEHTDTHVGRLLDHLRATGRMDDTLVLVCSDHGVPLTEHGTIRKIGMPLYDEMSRIVWTMAGAGVTCSADSAGGSVVRPTDWAGHSGRVSHALAQPQDLLATVVDLFELDTSSVPRLWGDEPGAPGGIEGTSLREVLAGTTDRVRGEAHFGVFGTRSAVVSWPWKLIDHRGQRPLELFDLATDPGELEDRSRTETDVVASLHHRMWRFANRWARAYHG